MTDLFEKPQVVMEVSEKPKRKKKEFTPEQKAKFVERMKKAREAKLLKKAQELNASKQQAEPKAEAEVVEKPKKTRKKKEQVVTQSHPQYDYSYINNLNTSINQLNQNLMNLASRTHNPQRTEGAKPTEASTKVKQEPKKIESEPKAKEEKKVEEPKVKMAEIPQKSTTNTNPTQKRKIWNATRRAYVYV